ncbi:ATP12 family chaperone protein [Hyphococcus sp.]|uniref:ATP12 family chaperone protein n=1 Tax=Hyphococcus sp. TaxID=2038636 RepID=UPI003CCBDB25
MTSAPPIKPFYKDVSLEKIHGRFHLMLDGRNARTKAKNPLSAPTESLGAALADEWAAQEKIIDQNAMPLTGILSTAIDGGEEAGEMWRNEILEYLNSDLVCYRAETPAALVDRQAAAWDPYLDFLRDDLGAALISTSGIVAVAQPGIAAEAVRNALLGAAPETLFALRLATAITGSAAMALALWRGAYPADDVFEASRVDERFQEERWGADEEAKAREARMRDEFISIGRFFSLMRD